MWSNRDELALFAIYGVTTLIITLAFFFLLRPSGMSYAYVRYSATTLLRVGF